jgi:HSP20 family molecular chaperone IbpA
MKINNEKRNLLMTSLMAVPACQRRDGDSDWFPAVDLAETGQEYVFEVDLPGLKSDEIQLDVDSDGILIRGKRLPWLKGMKRLRIERPSGTFVRHLPLPPDTAGEVLGSFCDGVLELRIPKAREDTKSNQALAVDHEPEEVSP